MSLFLAICQGVGLAIAAGTFAGASGRRNAIGVLLAIAAAAGGAILFALSMSNRDHPAIVGIPLGIILAVLAYGIVSAVVADAQARVRGASSIGLIVAATALVLAVVTAFVWEPFGLLLLLGLLWLASARHRRAQQKYEGLRSLR
jgi:phosphotransferase system  glucose/maltose/N-acetylglucosamine-specific IIC component